MVLRILQIEWTVVGVCLLVCLQNVSAFFFEQPKSSLSLDSIDDFLELNSNFTSLLDENIGFVSQSATEFEAQERSDTLDSDFEVNLSWKKDTQVKVADLHNGGQVY